MVGQEMMWSGARKDWRQAVSEQAEVSGLARGHAASHGASHWPSHARPALTYSMPSLKLDLLARDFATHIASSPSEYTMSSPVSDKIPVYSVQATGS